MVLPYLDADKLPERNIHFGIGSLHGHRINRWDSDDVGAINQVESEDTSAVQTINFDPLVLPDGIAGSDDPLLSARSAAYSQSFTRRMGESKAPSAVSSSEVSK